MSFYFLFLDIFVAGIHDRGGVLLADAGGERRDGEVGDMGHSGAGAVP